MNRKGPYSDQVKGFKKKWKAGRKAAKDLGSGGFIDEAMTGVFRLTLAEVGVIGPNDWLHICFQTVCLDPDDFRGQMHNHRCGLGEEQFQFLISDLAKLGVEVDDLEVDSMDDLKKVLEGLTKEQPTFRASLRHGKKDPKFMDMWISKLVEWEDDPAFVADDDPKALLGSHVFVSIKGKEREAIIESLNGKKYTVRVIKTGKKYKFKREVVTLA